MEPVVTRNRISDPLELFSEDEAEVSTLPMFHRKSLDNLSMQQQRSVSTISCRYATDWEEKK